MTQALIGKSEQKMSGQPWLRSAVWDSVFICAPAFLSAGLALLFKPYMESVEDLPLWAWVSFVLLVDVAHVYATLFRTYFNRQAWQKHSGLLTCLPLFCWIGGALLYAVGPLCFWRALAYLAVFHFVRQQYGFLVLYSRCDSALARRFRHLDHLCIYLATLFPLMFWHTNLPRKFSWFVEGDFFESIPAAASDLVFVLYAVVAGLYLVKELYLLKAGAEFNLPKNLIISGTALSWWVAIVAINSDMSFTMVNVLSHGLPYMALIWHYHHLSNLSLTGLLPRQTGPEAGQEMPWKEQFQKTVSGLAQSTLKIALNFAPAFILLLALLAYLEEGLWDGFIWREHLRFFQPFAALPAVADRNVLALLVPLLSLPQSVHYVLDGFIWRVKDRSSSWSA